MKKNYMFLLLAFAFNAQSQNIVFADPNFKETLLYASETHPLVTNLSGDFFAPDANGDYEISVQEAANVKSFHFLLFGNDIVNFGGIEHFVNLESIYAPFAQASTIDFTNLTHFKSLSAENSNLTVLDFSHCPDLRYVYCPDSQLTELNLTGVTLLEGLDVNHNHLSSLEVHAHSPVGTFGDGGLQVICSYNQLTSLIIEGALAELDVSFNLLTDLDLSNCSHNFSLTIVENPLVTLNLKNGSHQDAIFGWPIPAPEYICADEGYETESIIESYTNEGITTGYEINSYCSVTPGGQYFTLSGSTHVDSDGNGCDVGDPAYPNLHFEATNDSNQTTSFVANASGNYALWMPAGMYTIAPQIANPTYFNISPASISVDFDTQTGPVLQDFCITANGNHPDVSIVLIPKEQARPGFDTDYMLVYKNVGSSILSGSVGFDYDDSVVDLSSANPTVDVQLPGNLQWNFSGLEPFESRTVLLTLNLNAPTDTPALNDGDILDFTATATVANDENLLDNTTELSQVVVNSFDPNDKSCLEGNTIAPEAVGKFVHYMIRFENVGSAEAVNIFVRDVIDSGAFDIATLEPLGGSHPYFTRVDGDKVSFIFENINLPFDDANNDGYVLFKIKTKPSLVVGDSFSNTASIYFDYNHPIVTEPAVTTISVLKNKDFEFEDYVAIYPNPANDHLNLKIQNIEIASIGIYNTIGQQVLVIPNANNIKSIDVSVLKSGNYFLKINTNKGVSNTNFIKR